MDEKITLDVHYNRSSGSFESTYTVETEGCTVTKHKVGGTDAQALLKKVVMLLNASLEDLVGEDDYED